MLYNNHFFGCIKNERDKVTCYDYTMPCFIFLNFASVGQVLKIIHQLVDMV